MKQVFLSTVVVYDYISKEEKENHAKTMLANVFTIKDEYASTGEYCYTVKYVKEE